MKNSIRFAPLIGCICLGLMIWFAPNPEGLPLEAQHFFAIFVTLIVCIITRVLPMGGMALVAMATTLVFDLVPVQRAFGWFGQELCWRIVLAFFIARGFIKTGLGARIAYNFVKRVGQHTLGLSYSLLGTELLLAPAVC